MRFEKFADGIREDQGIVDFLGNALINGHVTVCPEPDLQKMRIFVIRDGFDRVGLQIRHIGETTEKAFCSL